MLERVKLHHTNVPIRFQCMMPTHRGQLTSYTTSYFTLLSVY